MYENKIVVVEVAEVEEGESASSEPEVGIVAAQQAAAVPSGPAEAFAGAVDTNNTGIDSDKNFEPYVNNMIAFKLL